MLATANPAVPGPTGTGDTPAPTAGRTVPAAGEHNGRMPDQDSDAPAPRHIPAPAATMFAWAPIPEPFKTLGSLEFSKLLIEKADVAVAPGIGFGEHGDDFVRIALVENEHRIRQAARNVKRFLSSATSTLDNVIPLSARR